MCIWSKYKCSLTRFYFDKKTFTQKDVLVFALIEWICALHIHYEDSTNSYHRAWTLESDTTEWKTTLHGTYGPSLNAFWEVFLSRYGFLELWRRNLRFAGYHSWVIKRIRFRCLAIPGLKWSSGNPSTWSL